MFEISYHHAYGGDPQEEDDDFGEDTSDGVHGAAAGEGIRAVMGESEGRFALALGA